MADNTKTQNSQEPTEELALDHSGCEIRLAEAEAKWKRALADYQNLERQTEEARTRFVKIATLGFVEELIEPYDHLLLATKHIHDKGLEMVIAQFRQVFERHGLKEINPVGMDFDPATMEGVGTKEGKKDSVVEVVSVGYLLHETLVRPAKVLVGIQKK